MSSKPKVGAGDPLLDVRTYATELDAWLGGRPECLRAVAAPIPTYAARVKAMVELMAVLHDRAWSRYGWPAEVGGRGGSILHRAAMWEALARHGVPGMALFEHLEVLAPTLVAHGPQPFVGEALPEFLAGRQLWAQGFSEPGAGSDLASLRTTACRTDEGWVVRALQVLGGIGFTAEHNHHHHHARVLALDALLGTSAALIPPLGAWLRSTRADPGFASTVLLGGPPR